MFDSLSLFNGCLIKNIQYCYTKVNKKLSTICTLERTSSCPLEGSSRQNRSQFHAQLSSRGKKYNIRISNIVFQKATHIHISWSPLVQATGKIIYCSTPLFHILQHTQRICLSPVLLKHTRTRQTQASWIRQCNALFRKK